MAELENQLVDYHKTQEELEDLSEFAGVKKDHEDYVLSDPCAIIGYVENDPFHAFYIDQGSEDGISVYDPVVTSEGLVGIISRFPSTIPPWKPSAPPISPSVRNLLKKESGIVEGDVTLTADYQCRMIYLEKETTLKEGDLIVTSNSVGIFPQGYLIGSVQHRMADGQRLDCCAIRPSVDLASLTNVIVITDFAGKEQKDAEN